MSAKNRLFLLGGSQAIKLTAAAFVQAAGGRKARIAVLLQGGLAWQTYWPLYSEPLAQHGVAEFIPIVPDEAGNLDIDQAEASLARATGILIGGGHTPTYHRLYAREPLRDLIRTRYGRHVPVAGLSAGAVILSEKCFLSEEGAQARPGLDLLHFVMVQVHYDPAQGTHILQHSLRQANLPVGYALGEAAGAIFEDGVIEQAVGYPVVQVKQRRGGFDVRQLTFP